MRLQYECCDAQGQWRRANGNEQWKLNAHGLMQWRQASINDVAIDVSERKFLWPAGARPVDYPGLRELGL